MNSLIPTPPTDNIDRIDEIKKIDIKKSSSVFISKDLIIKSMLIIWSICIRIEYKKDLKKIFPDLKIIDEIISEPLGGAHRDPELIASDIKHSITKSLKSFEGYSKDEIYDHRKSKFLQIGRDQGFSKSSNISDGGLSYKESTFSKVKMHLIKNKYIYGGIGLVVFVGLITLIS